MGLLDVKIGPKAPEFVNAVIEIPRGSSNKYELDMESGVMRLDRVLYSPLFYPFDYGFVPQTQYLDGDPIDILVMVSHPTYPGVVVEATPVGVLNMRDEKGPDEKILAVAVRDPRFGYRRSMAQLNDHTRKEIVHFFEVYKQLEDKFVEVLGWDDREKAIELIERYRTDR